MKIVHDPGHGGNNYGVCVDGFVEKEWTLAFSKRIYSSNVFLPGISTAFTRLSDIDLSLEERGDIVRRFDADLVLCHHVNGIFIHDESTGVDIPNETVDGIMCFVLDGCPISPHVAKAITRAAPLGLLRSNFKVYTARPDNWTRDVYAVLREYGGTPAVLIEWGFATSPNDRDILESDKYFISLVAATLAGIGAAKSLI